MTVKEVLTKYDSLVPFPWTLQKIIKAGFIPTDFFLALGQELRKCDDVNTATGQQVLESLDQLKSTKGNQK